MLNFNALCHEANEFHSSSSENEYNLVTIVHSSITNDGGNMKIIISSMEKYVVFLIKY